MKHSKHLIIYFEDNVLHDLSLEGVVRIDAAMGVRHFHTSVRNILHSMEYGVGKIYTNNLIVLNPIYSGFAWNSDLLHFDIYLRCPVSKQWRPIQDFCDHKLRSGCNLLQLYVNGDFYGPPLNT